VGNGSDSDVSSGLNELESKLRELERAFSTLGHDLEPATAPVAAAPPVVAPALVPAAPPPPVVALAPAPSAPATPDAGVQAQIDELMRSQERLTATVQALVSDVTRLVEGLAAPVPAPTPATATATTWAQPAVIHPLPLRVPDDPTPPPPARSVRDYAPHPPASRDDGA
jgi:hypothetical protein